ncbi:MAG: D-glycero-beta-D-manno-heptose 1-phosphate adenylyltransferase [Desulfobulbaceae bacterium]|nr:D-glycero-beta-D-manno-heptose 1-phosphate adenylyltransferase [Desulfobulbaceae bacterium]
MNDSFFPAAAVIQFKVVQGNIEDNVSRLHGMLAKLQPENGTMIVLPELWAHGFDYRHTGTLAKRYDYLVGLLSEAAARYDVYLAGSLLEPSGFAEPYNTLCVVGPDGLLGRYRKQHLFSYWREGEFFIPGDGYEPINTLHGLVGGVVCYDLRFPVIAREQVFRGSELLIVSAQWPLSRLNHWTTLLRARAIENQVFVVACNSCGVSGDTEFGGHSMVIGPDGTVLVELSEDEGFGRSPLIRDSLDKARLNFCSVGECRYPGDDQDKVVTLERALGVLADIRKQRGKVAFTNGCFDILHAGHVEYLEEARKSGDFLVVGINSDRSVRELKGDCRPVNPEEQRARVLAALGCIDLVIIFDEETPHSLITAILPDVLVKGADWPEDQIVGGLEVKANGGEVLRIPFASQVSTTKVIDKIKQKR